MLKSEVKLTLIQRCFWLSFVSLRQLLTLGLIFACFRLETVDLEKATDVSFGRLSCMQAEAFLPRRYSFFELWQHKLVMKGKHRLDVPKNSGHYIRIEHWLFLVFLLYDVEQGLKINTNDMCSEKNCNPLANEANSLRQLWKPSPPKGNVQQQVPKSIKFCLCFTTARWFRLRT